MVDKVVIRICEIGFNDPQTASDSGCKIYYPVLTDDEIDERRNIDHNFNYIRYTVDAYMDEIHGDETLHWICKRCNRESYHDV